MANGVQLDQSVIQRGLASAGLPALPQLFQSQQAGIFGGGPAKEEAAARRNEPIGFLERRFGTGKKARERTQKQRVKDAKALGSLARSQGIETDAALGQGIAQQLESSFGAQGAAQILAEREKQLPANVAEQQRLKREQRKATQRAGLKFAQETENRFLEARLKTAQIDREQQGLLDDKTQANFKNQTGFDNPQDMVKTSGEIGAVNSALSSVQGMIQIRKDLGAIGPIDFLANPDAAAHVKDFQKFESVNLFKTLANDTRLSDEDRDFYGSIVELTAADIIGTGGKVELAQLENLERRLTSTMSTFEFAYGDTLGQLQPQLFARPNFEDRPPLTFQSFGAGQTPAGVQEAGGVAGIGGTPLPAAPLGSFAGQ